MCPHHNQMIGVGELVKDYNVAVQPQREELGHSQHRQRSFCDRWYEARFQKQEAPLDNYNTNRSSNKCLDNTVHLHISVKLILQLSIPDLFIVHLELVHDDASSTVQINTKLLVPRDSMHVSVHCPIYLLTSPR